MPTGPLPTVLDIKVYPIKACHSITLNECEVDTLGIKHDRRFMIIDNKANRFISQRKYSSFALIQPLIDDQKNTLTLTAKDQSDLTLPIKPDVTKLSKRQVQLWKHKLDVYDMGDHAAQWVNQFLSNNRPHDHANSGTDETSEPDCRLVTVDDPQNGMYKRPAHPKIPGVHAAFQDWSPISLGFNSSLDALNDGMVDSGFSQGSRIPITRFRNNITISGTIAWEEDEWLVVKIGEVHAYIIQPIARCNVPSIDQDSGIKETWDGKGPTDYLKVVRRFQDQPGDGQFCCDVVPLTSGKIKLGDTIQVLERIPEEYQQRPIVLEEALESI